MRKVLLIVLIFVVISSLGFSQDSDIRKLKWGMTYDQVMATENLKDSLYKQEELLGTKVEIVFGLGKTGLHSVIYSSKDMAFTEKASAVLTKKYGEPGKGIDYAFLVEAQKILKQYPKAVVELYTQQDYSELNRVGQSSRDSKKIIKGGLAKRQKWEYGNTVALLLDNGTEGGILSYRPKKVHEQSKAEFLQIMEELKKMVKKEQDKEASEAEENF